MANNSVTLSGFDVAEITPDFNGSRMYTANCTCDTENCLQILDSPLSTNVITQLNPQGSTITMIVTCNQTTANPIPSLYFDYTFNGVSSTIAAAGGAVCT